MSILTPNATTLAVLAGRWFALTHDGELLSGSLRDPVPNTQGKALLLCHGPYAAARVTLPPAPLLDVLELFAFVRPAQFCVPTIHGMARILGLSVPATPDDASLTLLEIVRCLLMELQDTPAKTKDSVLALAQTMGQQGRGWTWTPFVCAALGTPYDAAAPTKPKESLGVISRLPEWADEAPPPPPSAYPLSGDAARAHLKELLMRRRGAGRASEPRPAQEDYTTRILATFEERHDDNAPHVVTAEAGTGVGKTLGYLAPAQAWAALNTGQVWVSTYTKNLQRQIDQECHILYPEPENRTRKAVIRKGRENYLCLLNAEETGAMAAQSRDPRRLVAAGLMARWIMHTRDGDLSGADFPGWLPRLFDVQDTLGLADRRGECIYAACQHYHRCFIERSTRKAQRAELVIGNHALAMAQLALSDDPIRLPQRFIFDEGHHVFDAADSTFSAHLTGTDTHDLRRWIIGPEDEGTSTRRLRRARGLKKRLEGVIPDDDPARALIDHAVEAARQLPGPAWRKTLGAGEPVGPVETFLHHIRSQVKARASDPHSPYAIECDTHPLEPAIMADIPHVLKALHAIQKPLQKLAKHLRDLEADGAETLPTDQRNRLNALAQGLERRAQFILGSWIAMVDDLREPQGSGTADWFEMARNDGKDVDVGYARHAIDPTKPFAEALRRVAHGVLMTSATLKDSQGDDETTWHVADQRTGATHLSEMTPVRLAIPSPFAYATQTRVLVVKDIAKNDAAGLANAYQRLALATDGGALGLFTAIHRLRGVHARMRDALEAQGIPLYAQHVDDIDIGTLIDMFREDENACLLGTDAVRDGVDVPGRSLRLIVFDRVPWPRPTILHRERRKAFGGRAYDEASTRIKLRQAYGRLVRTPQDRGLFVMLDSGFPSRLADSFPGGVPVERVTLDEAVGIAGTFF